MSSIDNILRLSLMRLVSVLESKTVEVTGLEAGEMFGLLEVLTARIIGEWSALSWDERRSCSAAMMHVIDSAESAGVISRDEAAIRMLNIMAVLIRDDGVNENIELLSAKRVIRVLFRALPISVNEARRLAPQWRGLDIDQIRRLRLAKNLLSPVLIIERELNDARLSDWAEIKPLLP